MNASRRGSGIVRQKCFPPPIATMWPFTSGQDKVTSAPGVRLPVCFHGEGAYSDVTLLRASAALGAVALAVAVPGGVSAKTQPKHTTTVVTVNQLPTAETLP